MRFNYWIVLSVVTLFFTAAYFFLNPSYELSLEAKFHYAMGDYKLAQQKATKAFEMNKYNRMASTVMTQSQTAMKFVKYIDESKKYMREIAEIASGEGVTDAERAKVKMMCEIMIESYKKIAPTVLTDEDLIKEAADYNLKFKKLYDEITAKI